MSNLQTCWRQTVCQNRLPPASPQGITAFAAQGGAGLQWGPQSVKRFEAPTEPAGETSHLDGTKWRNILGHAAFFC